MATMLEKKGTCPACLGEFRCWDNSGKVVVGKHGWVEYGGRQVGEHGRAWHQGECFGTGWAPFELSPEGTWAFLAEIVFPSCLGGIDQLTRLNGRPSLTVGVEDSKPIVLTPDNEAGSKTRKRWTPDGYVTTSAYDDELARRIAAENRALESNKELGAALYSKAEAWVAAELKDAPPEGPTVHFKKEGARSAYCSPRGYSITYVSDENLVTCTRCLKALETSKREQAIYDGITADAETLVGHLRDHGPQTKAQLKKALGWDTKRVNKAVERTQGYTGRIGVQADRRVTSEYSTKGPDKYRLTTEEERARWAR